MQFIKIVVAGSTGYLADHAIPALLNSTKPKFDVTVLTRANSGKNPSLPGAKIIPIDYEDHAALVRAVTGADAIVSLVSGGANRLVDPNLLKAAQEAGVRRIFPSEYTLDVLHPKAVSLLSEGGHWPDNVTPVNDARNFLALANQDGPTSFTTIVPAAFMDSWLEGEFGFFEPKNRKATVLDGGDHYFTGCSLPFLAASIVAILQMDEEATKNKRIPVAEVRTTMNEIVESYEEAMGAKFEKVPVTSQQLVDQRNDSLKTGNAFAALFVTIKIGAFDGSGAGDLKDGLQFDGDGFLAMKRKTLRELTAEAVEKIGIA
ncbi:Isoflavone reductase-like protein [Cladobotryum mycophilum]|uniref:Isoflavone reductase-like protein n=1 Tax=Cladobotryum mycophilum TaxID=491253 RepID=A0ABR0SPT5_9HYPO